MEEKIPTNHKSVAGKVLRFLFKTVLIIILLIATVALLILTPPVQNFAREKATAWLTNKLHTKVDIGRIYIGFPKKVVLENVYIEDQKKDTLLSGGQLKVDISMLKLLHSEVEVSQIQLSEITAKIKRVLPDTVYNFQFIIDAFASAGTATKKTSDTSSMKISVKGVELDKIRVVYDDGVTGNDMTVWLEHFDTDIDEFDLNKMRFSVPTTNISGIRAKIYQHKPLVVPVTVVADTALTIAAPPLDFDFGKLNLSDLNVDYGNDVSAFYTNLRLGKFSVNADDIDMQKQLVTLNKIQLDNTTVGIRMGKTVVVKKTVKRDTTLQTSSGWRIIVKKIELNNNNLAFADDNTPVLKKGMDYSHLDAKGVTIHASDFIFSPDSIGVNITKGELTEKSGFRLNTLKTEFLYSSTNSFLHNLVIETPGSFIKRSIDLRYPSLDDLKKDIGKLQLNADITNSRIQVKDILTFVPALAAQPAFADPTSTLFLTGRIEGRIANMNIRTLQLRAFNNTEINVRGTVAGLPNAKKVSGNLLIQKFTTSRKDIQMLAPKGSLPKNITIPEIMNLQGSISGSMQAGRAKLNLTSSLGDASVNGTISNATNKKTAKYDATVTARNLNLGVIMQNDSMFGLLTATISAAGTGFDQKTAKANVNASINSAVLNRYKYNNVKLHANLASQKANFNFGIKDPNITINLTGKSDLAAKFPTISLDAVIDSLNTLPLNLTPDVLMYKGVVHANFPSTDPANLVGQLLVTKSVLATKDQRYPLDTISLTAGKTDTGQFVRLKSDVMSFALSGKYHLAQLGSVISQSIQPYYSLGPVVNKDTLQDYDFRFSAYLVNGPLLKIFMPTLERMEPVKMQGHFVSNQGFQSSVESPLIIMGTNRIQNLKINAGTNRNALRLRMELEQFSSGASVNIFATTLNADIADNTINFLVNLKDIDRKNKYRFGGLFEQPQNGIYAIKINPDSLLLNYTKWNMAKDNLVKLNKGDVNIRNFTISKGNQQLSINSGSDIANSPMDIKLKDFRIATITAFAKQDSAFIDGIINGEATIKNITTQPTFTSDIAVNDLMFRTDTVGNLNLKVNNTTQNVFAAEVSLSGKGNDIAIKGNYQVKPKDQSVIDLVLDIRKLQMSSVQAFSMGAISKGSGYLNGKFNFAGTFAKPELNGGINFNQASFTPATLGSYFTIDQESIKVNNDGIIFNAFTILDSAKNKLVLDGSALTSNFINYKLNLDLKAINFQALNSTKQNSKLFYGQFFFDTRLKITGTEASPKIDGRLKVNDKTKLTVVLPQSQPGVEDREGIVRFIDVDSIKLNKTLAVTPTDSLSKSDLRGMDISVNIEIDKAAELTLIVDEANGDFLSMKGTAQLTGGIDPSGKTTLTGSYEIEEGAYQLSLNLLQRKFQIQKGSKIIWLGDPTKADVSVTAIYVANTAPISLIENQMPVQNLNIYKQKLPFQVKLMLGGELLKPDISFDITLPADKSFKVDATVIENVDTRLTQLKSEPSELNKQVFALLLLNRFVQENPFANSGDGGFNAGTFARTSVSKLLTEQLNSLASDLISGVDLNFDVASTEDYTTGSMKNRTDLNVSLSKQLLNDRVKVTVGSNFELEGPQQTNQRSNNLAGNVGLDYMLSKDGRYLLRAYRKNEYEGELDGYIIETGVNFILSLDYDHFHDLFSRKKQRKIRQERNDLTEENDTRKAAL